MAEDLEGGHEGQARHHGRDQDVRPARAQREHAARREEDRDVAEHVVARAEPHRAHVAVAVAVAVEQQRDAEVRRQGEQRRDAHRPRVGHLAAGYAEYRPGEHPEAEKAHGDALERRHARPNLEGPRHRPEAQGVVSSVAEEVESVRLQGQRAGEDARGDLDQEHEGVDRQRDPEHSPVAGIAGDRCVAAVFAHGGTSRSDAAQARACSDYRVKRRRDVGGCEETHRPARG